MALSPHASTSTPTVVAFPADPILAAIAAHRLGWTAFANATPETVEGAALMQRGAMANLLGTPFTTRAGAETLLRHLRASLAANGRTLCLDAPTTGLATARACDLALLIGLPGARAPIGLGEAAAAVVRSLNRAGEAVAALAIVAGGAVLVGLASVL